METQRSGQSDDTDDPTVRAIKKLRRGPRDDEQHTLDIWLLNVEYVLNSRPELENLSRSLPAELRRRIDKSALRTAQSSLPSVEVEQVKHVLDAARERLSDARRITMNAAAEQAIREAIASPGIQDTVRAMLRDRIDSAVLRSKWVIRGIPLFFGSLFIAFLGGTIAGIYEFQGVDKVASESRAAIVTARKDALDELKNDLTQKAEIQATEIKHSGDVAKQLVAKATKRAQDDLKGSVDGLSSSVMTNETVSKSLYARLKPLQAKYTVLEARSADLSMTMNMLDAVLSKKRYEPIMADHNTAANGFGMFVGRTTYASWGCLALVDHCTLFIDLGTQAPLRQPERARRGVW